ncbi:Rrp15p-domain-containing protein [Lactarius vividus]|nr:Rrp15p-domain-containing protein [Lactarius vividus]
MTSEASLSHPTAENYQSDGQESSYQSPDTEDEIVQARLAKSKKTLKRKHRATDASNFGATLQSLLKTDTPSGLPLSLKPSVARKRNDEKLELRAKKLLKGEKKCKEEVGRVKDVIGGWGGESERTLRKVAQRGVVKLFNAIQQSQASAAVAEKELKNTRGSGKPTLPAPSFDKKLKSKNKDTLSLDKDNFMEMIRSGGVVSKT